MLLHKHAALSLKRSMLGVRTLKSASLSPRSSSHLLLPSSTTPSLQLLHKAKLWAQVSKLQLSAMVVLSSSCGFLLAGPVFDLPTLLNVTLGTSLAAASASAFNQVYEKKTDQLMLRTRHRPLPLGLVSQRQVTVFALAMLLSSYTVLSVGTNPLTLSLGMANIFLYSAVYTPLKQHTEWNTWIGALVGALPPLMGYTAATGGVLDSSALLLGSGLFLWQFPHFFALAWLLRKDYARGRHYMVSVRDSTGSRTAQIMMRYSLALSAVPMMAYALDCTSFMFPLESLLFNGGLIYHSYRFQQDASDDHARKVFRTSLWYLPVFMGLFVLHSKRNQWKNKKDQDVYARWGDYQLRIPSSSSSSTMRDWCVHEWALLNRNDSVKCPKIELDQIKLIAAVAGTEFPP